MPVNLIFLIGAVLMALCLLIIFIAATYLAVRLHIDRGRYGYPRTRKQNDSKDEQIRRFR